MAKNDSRVFISYRRADGDFASSYAGLLLRQRLGELVGETSVFQDVINIQTGADFEQAIVTALQGVKVVLVLIGPDWAAEMRRRFAEGIPDYTRLEVEKALQSEALTIPVLLSGVQMPAPGDLPESIQGICRLNAAPLRAAEFDDDLETLIRRLHSASLPTMSAALRRMAGIFARNNADNPNRAQATAATLLELARWSEGKNLLPADFLTGLQLVGRASFMEVQEDGKVKNRRATIDEWKTILAHEIGITPSGKIEGAYDVFSYFHECSELAKKKATDETKWRYGGMAEAYGREAMEILSAV